ncbi:MAG TPA: hypothetical protein VIF88_16555 [Methylocystis sp.]|jgi:hypothetical protein
MLLLNQSIAAVRRLARLLDEKANKVDKRIAADAELIETRARRRLAWFERNAAQADSPGN